MSIVDDRLVGYLSLGSTQPDSLAIKHIIDEKLSIRGVKEALLKGDFDVRKYFSRSRSLAAQDMVTSGKMPVVNSLISSLLVTDPLARPYPQCITPAGALLPLPTPMTSRMGRPHTEPLHEPIAVLSSIDSQLTIHEWEEEMRPSTDKLPVNSKKVVESILIPLPSRPASRNLWSYSEKIPAIVARSSSVQHPVPVKMERASDHEKVEHANFLL